MTFATEARRRVSRHRDFPRSGSVQPERLRLIIADDEPLARALVRQYASTDEADSKSSPRPPPATSFRTRWRTNDQTSRSSTSACRVRTCSTCWLARRLVAGCCPPIIFSTAFDAYAVRAFELNAVDYLIKPYSADRFREALRRARRHRNGRRPWSRTGPTGPRAEA